MKFLVAIGVVALASLAAVSFAENEEEQLQELSGPEIRMRIFRAFMRLYNKNYTEQDIPRRLELFWRRREQIRKSIKDFEEGRSNYTLAENKFMDLNEEEVERLHGMRMPSKEELERQLAEFSGEEEEEAPGQQSGPTSDLPSSMDWRVRGCGRNVYSQGDCGSCYATAVAGALEDLRCLYQGSSPELSFQQIVDCGSKTPGYQLNGCGGGWTQDAIKYMRDVAWASTSRCYPNKEREGECIINQMTSSCLVRSSPTNRERLSFRVLRGVEQMKSALARHGPIVAAMEASDNVHLFGRGIYEGDDCDYSRRDLNHAVVLVGYGSENGRDYFIMRNSWGTWWAEGGFMRIRTNACWIDSLGWAITA